MINPLTADAIERVVSPGQLMLLFSGLLVGLIPAALAGGTDLEQPAQLQLTILDEQHQALPATRVWWQEAEPVWPETSAARTLLPVDASGRVDLQRHRPDDAIEIVWTETLRIEVDGFASRDLSVWLFPGAQQQVTVTMQREHVTLIRLRGPQDKPLPRVTEFRCFAGSLVP